MRKEEEGTEEEKIKKRGCKDSHVDDDDSRVDSRSQDLSRSHRVRVGSALDPLRVHTISRSLSLIILKAVFT